MVTDDIVTRLRNKRTEFDNWLNDIEGKHSFGHDESIWLDAADEIERLRADVQRWSNWAIDYACDDTKCECDRCTEVRKAWDEAQRNR